VSKKLNYEDYRLDCLTQSSLVPTHFGISRNALILMKASLNHTRNRYDSGTKNFTKGGLI
ncbi:MAG: hypothetical protein JSV13_04395, partial [Nitrospiraceae bacterium]